MSDKHKESRTWLTINTGLFLGASALLGVNAVYNIIDAPGTFGLITTFGSLGIYGWLGIGNLRGAWKAFSDLEYGKTMSKGLISWIVPAGLVLLDYIF